MTVSTVTRSDAATGRQLLALVPEWSTDEATRILAADGSYTVGRSRRCDIVLSADGMADVHFQIACRAGSAVANPLGSADLFVNGQPVKGPRQLKIGDRLAAGEAVFRVDFRSDQLLRRQHGSLNPSATSPPSTTAGRHRGADFLSPPTKPVSVSETEDAETIRQWQQRLELQASELNRRAEQLAEQQAKFLQNQNLFEQRAAQIEAAQKQAFRELDLRRELVTENEQAVTCERETVTRLLAELKAERKSLRSAREKFEAQQRETLSRFAAQQQELDESLQQLEQQRRLLADEASQLDERRILLDALREEDDLRLQKTEHSLTIREEEVAFAERDLAAARELLDRSRAELQEVESQTREELNRERCLLEEQAAGRMEKLASWEAELQQYRDELDAREADLRAREEQSRDVEERAVMLDNRERQLAEREEQLEQLSDRLATTERSVADRESAVQEALDHLRAQQEEHESTVRQWQDDAAAADAQAASREQQLHELRTSLEQQAAELQLQAERLHAAQAAIDSEDRPNEAGDIAAWEAELNARHNEIAERIAEFQRLRRQAAHVPAQPDVDNAALMEELEESRRRAEKLQLERDELSTALTELRAAFEVLRDELQQMQAGSDNADSNVAEEQLRHQDEQLSELRRQLENRDSENQLLQQQITLLSEQVLHEKHRNTEDTAEVIADGDASDREARLLAEVEQLRVEVAAARTETADRTEGDGETQQYLDVIQRLEQQIEQLRKEQDERPVADSAMPEDQLQLIAELRQRLEEAESQLQQYRSQSAESSVGATDENTLMTLHRELDTRTMLLDTREEELRERGRMLEHSEAEIEQQRRELREARQQIELARAELQQKMDSARDASIEADVDAILDATPASPTHEEHADDIDEEPSEQDTPHVRSELAELFGIHTNAHVPPSKPVAVTDLPAVDEYSQEEEAAVAMSFSNASAMLAEASPQEHDTVEDDSDEDEQDGDEFVARYMEQLLARNRAKAGGALPEELKKADAASTSSGSPVVKETSSSATATEPALQKSFIDAYLSGEYDDQTVADSVKEVIEAETAAMDPAHRPERQKIDLEALRSNMDSFRQLSAKSVENALATHARRQSRGGIKARFAILGVLFLACLFLFAAASAGIIALGIPVWLSVAAVLASGVELLWKLMTIRRSVSKTREFLQAHGVPTEVAEQEALLAHERSSGAPEPNSAEAAFGTNESTTPHDEGPESRENSTAHDGAEGPADENEDPYFEL